MSKNALTRDCSFQLVTYGIASASLLVALYKIRPVSISIPASFSLTLLTASVHTFHKFVSPLVIPQFAKFKKPSDVPFYFLRSRVPLQGTVMRVEPSNGVLLMVNHKSLLPFPRFNNKSYLPVKVSGIDVTSNGKYQT